MGTSSISPTQASSRNTIRSKICAIIRSVRLGNDFAQLVQRRSVDDNGRFLIAFTEGKVQVIDAGGKILWQCRVSGACHATRLPNGNTLVASMVQHKVLVLDKDGKCR